MARLIFHRYGTCKVVGGHMRGGRTYCLDGADYWTVAPDGTRWEITTERDRPRAPAVWSAFRDGGECEEDWIVALSRKELEDKILDS